MNPGLSALQSSAPPAIVAALQRAASRTGVDFSYLLANARAESGLDPSARARTSSASGLFQFTDATWLGMVERHGGAHGLGWAADALKAGAGQAVKDSILSLRHNAEVSATMAGEFTRDNAARLESALGRAASATDLYLAAFFGAAGAVRFLAGLAAAPDMAAASLLPAAAAANRESFYDASGRARSLAEIHGLVARRIGQSGLSAQDAAMPALAATAPAPGGTNPPPDGTTSPHYDPELVTARARMAYLVLAALQ